MTGKRLATRRGGGDQSVPATLSRRSFLAASAAASAAAFAAAAQGAAPQTSHGQDRIRLFSLPTRVFKKPDNKREQTEAWFLTLIVESDDAAARTPIGMQLSYLSNNVEVKTEHYSRLSLATLLVPQSLPPHLPNGDPPARPVHWPCALRVRCREPIALKVDRMRIALTVTNAAGHREQAVIEIEPTYYAQKTPLIFPFKGHGLILNAGVANAGHRNRSGQFALDGFVTDGLTALLNSEKDTLNASFIGWNWPLVAPADGTVVFVRRDRPNQPHAQSEDPSYFAPEFRNGGDPGNHMIIDHGNDEYSMIAHFQEGSILVNVGDRVRQGDPIGRLGSSGDTSAPHVHYQLQNGPKWQYADGLPCVFRNIEDSENLDRGSFFEAV